MLSEKLKALTEIQSGVRWGNDQFKEEIEQLTGRRTPPMEQGLKPSQRA